MTPDSLREQLQGFHRLQAREERKAWGQARLAPLPAVDDEFSDLFRDQTLDDVGEAFRGARGGQRRWARFILAGCRRREDRDERRALALSLEKCRLGDAGRENEAAMEQALALAAAGEHREDENASPGDDAVCRNLLAQRAGLEDLRRHCGEASGELRQALPAGREDAVWRSLIEAAGFLRRGDGEIRRTTGLESGCLPEAIPQIIHLVVQPGAGLEAWEGQLQAAGAALALAHLPRDLVAEDRWLPGGGGAGVYGRLWARRLLQPSWLESVGVTGSRQEIVTGQARKRLAARLLDLAEASVAGRPGLLPPGWSWLASWPADSAAAMAQLCGLPTAPAMLRDEHLAALLDHVLLRRWGHRWERSRQGADLLRQLWSEGWARPLTELLSFLGELDPHGDALLEIF
ncbi:MAG: hypothetical protein E2P03_00730 [Acidobacteria bacterium]|nr:MAG: hypothetical protein E2P03_00730 [Acidobacteriota bacterium]